MPALAEPSPPNRLRRGRGARVAWLILGLALVGIGFVGIFVPLLPTIDFILLALPCFARSSPRLESWLLDHPRFGPAISAWRRERAVPRHAKVMALLGMMLGYAIFWLHVRSSWLVSLAVAAFLLFWGIWIACRPEPAVRP